MGRQVSLRCSADIRDIDVSDLLIPRVSAEILVFVCLAFSSMELLLIRRT